MIVMAIDPGNVQSAWVVMNGQNKILGKGKEDNYIVLQRIKKLREKLSYLVCEMISGYGKVGKSIFFTCVWIGKFKHAFMLNNLEKPANFFFVYRKTVSTYICENPKAKDGDVRQAMIDTYGEPGTKKHPGRTYGFTKDMWQALGLAHYFVDAHTHNMMPADMEAEMVGEYYANIERKKKK